MRKLLQRVGLEYRLGGLQSLAQPLARNRDAAIEVRQHPGNRQTCLREVLRNIAETLGKRLLVRASQDRPLSRPTISCVSIHAAAALLIIALFASVAHAQTTVTLNGTTYTTKSPPIAWFDGAGGVIQSGLAGKANSGNPAWTALNYSSTLLNGTYPYTSIDNQLLYNDGFGASVNAALCLTNSTTFAANCAIAKDQILNVQEYFPFLCNELEGDCIINGGEGYYVGSYGIIYYVPEWVTAFQALIAAGQLSSGDEALFADKILNDRSTAGGISGSPSTSCTNPTTVTGFNVSLASSGVITSTSPVFGAGQPIQVGYWLDVQNGVTAKVASIADSTHATIDSRSAGGTYTGPLAYRRNTWSAGDCGILWLVKHGRYAPQVLAYVSGSPVYPVIPPVGGDMAQGGTFADPQSNNTFATYQGYMSALIGTVNYDANASARSKAQITALYNDWFTNIDQAYLVSNWTGIHHDGAQYGLTRPPQMSSFPAILEMSLTSAPSMGTLWAENLLTHYNYAISPGNQSAEPAWGQNGESATPWSTQYLAFQAPNYFIYRNTTQGKYFNWLIQNYFTVTGNWGNPVGTNLLWTAGALEGNAAGNNIDGVFYYTDPAFPTLNINSGPDSVALNQVDTPSGSVLPQSVMFSRTGFSSSTDSLVEFFGSSEALADHNCRVNNPTPCAPGDYKIEKGNLLLADDGDLNNTYDIVYNNYNNGGPSSNYVEIGGAFNLVIGPNNATMPRANTDGSSNRYAYAMVDSTPAYLSGVGATLVQRHLVDFKEGQQFVFVWDDVATSGGQQKQLYLQYPNNFGASSDSTRGATVVTGPSIVSSSPGTGHSDAAQLLTKVIPVDGANSVYTYTNNSNGTYSGGFNTTFRVSACASTTGSSCNTSNTEAHFGVIHEPVLGTSNTMPATAVLTSDANHQAMQVAGASPKVASFPLGGALYNTASLTSTFTGTAQYLITGMVTGTYTVSGAVSSSCVVAASDNSCYFEGGPGAISLAVGTPTAATPTFSPTAPYTGTAISVTIASTTGGAALCYTLDGSTPLAATPGTCSHGTTYSGPVSISTTATLSAIATESGFINSSVASGVYTITAGGTVIGNATVGSVTIN